MSRIALFRSSAAFLGLCLLPVLLSAHVERFSGLPYRGLFWKNSHYELCFQLRNQKLQTFVMQKSCQDLTMVTLQTKVYFSPNRPLGRFGLVVAMSIYIRIYMSPFHVIYFEASHWPSACGRIYQAADCWQDQTGSRPLAGSTR